MKTLKELYEKVLYEFLHNHKTNIGICNIIYALRNFQIINNDEYELISKDFDSRKPHPFNKEYYNKYFNTLNSKHGDFKRHFWWALNEKGFQRRVLFLQKIIDSL